MSSSFNNVVLLIVFNYADCVKNKDYFINLYGSYFKKIIFYSDLSHDSLDKDVHYLPIHKGYYTYKVFNHYFNNYQELINDSDGMFYLMDDNIINLNILNNIRCDKIILTQDSLNSCKKPEDNFENYQGWWWEYPCGKTQIRKLVQDTIFKDKFSSQKFIGGFSDYLYLPTKFITQELRELFILYEKYEIFLEIAIPSAIRYIHKDENDYQKFTESVLWGNDRNKVKDKNWLIEEFKSKLFIHPIKFGENPEYKNWLTDIFKIKKCIVITTINKPSKQVLEYTNKKGWDLIVVGDTKTDHQSYKDVNCIYLDLEKQKLLSNNLYDKIPFCSYTRKMFGYLYAIRNNYQVIYDTDDDNVYTGNLDEYQSNIEYKDNIDYPGNDIDKSNIFCFSKDLINLHINKSEKIKYFTFNKNNNDLWIKDKMTQMNNLSFTTSGSVINNKVVNGNGFVNLYKAYTDDKYIYPRGIPPNHPSINTELNITEENIQLKPCIVQGLVNNDPDVDANYRINISNQPFTFEKDFGNIILNKYAVCPINTQNTFWFDSSTFYNMYLPVTVSFRYTDILRGFITLFQLWKEGKTVKFTKPTAFQERNSHNLNKDYEDEIVMYETAEQVIDLFKNNPNLSIIEMYEILSEHNIVKKEEIDILKIWLNEIC